MINEKYHQAPKGGFNKLSIENILKTAKDVAVQLHNGDEYYIPPFMHNKGKLDPDYADNKTIILVDRDGEEMEFKYSDISQIQESLNEGRIQIKRKYGERGTIKTIQKAPLRNSILNELGDKIVSEDDMKNILLKVEEDLGKPYNRTKWFRNNQRYFDRIKTSEGWSYRLSKYGKRVYDSIQNVNKKMLTEMEKLPSFSNFLIENEITSVFEGKSEVQQAIKHIMSGAGWASTEYLEQFGGPSGLSSSDLTELAVELAKRGLLFKEEDLEDNHIMDGDNPANDDIDSVSVADAKKMKF